MTRFAAVADVHGNRWALEAAAEDIEREGIRDVLNLGDHLSGPLDVDGTAQLLMRLDWPGVSGNQDRELAEAGSPHSAWLASFPLTRELPGILMFHGTPAADNVYLPETVHPGGVSLATSAEIAARLGSVEPPLLLCGHTHIPRVVHCGRHLIVNPGSVGLQAYADDAPLPHLMETGSPHARYAILEADGADWRVDLRTIRYDWESAARFAARNQREDWAFRLRTGRAR
ncbi:MAG: metallophosphoesterase family protein [Acidobacteriota bacterium]|nr:metallophosphoesterase family protein [Acidobacteriota bacterium]